MLLMLSVCPAAAIEELVDGGGIMADADMPYRGQDAFCRVNQTSAERVQFKVCGQAVPSKLCLALAMLGTCSCMLSGMHASDDVLSGPCSLQPVELLTGVKCLQLYSLIMAICSYGIDA